MCAGEEIRREAMMWVGDGARCAASEQDTTIPEGMVLGRDTQEFAKSRYDFVLKAIHRFQDQAADEKALTQVRAWVRRSEHVHRRRRRETQPPPHRLMPPLVCARRKT